MSNGTLTLFCLAFLAMYSLPHIFFRVEGRKSTLMFWVTGTPYGIAPTALFLAQRGQLPTFVDPHSHLGQWLEVASVPFAVASIALIFSTMAVHRVPIALWHQPDDAPKSIVTWGPYSRVRHPFYLAFILLMTGTVVLSPQIVTVGCLVVALMLFQVTARREERRLLASPFGAEYEAYLKRTGRFFPRIFSTTPTPTPTAS